MAAPPDSAPGESARAQDLITSRQPALLTRAVETLRTCPDDELVGQAHRMAGTLGTFQLPEASAVLRDLEVALEAGDLTPEQSAQRRADAISELQALLEARS